MNRLDKYMLNNPNKQILLQTESTYKFNKMMHDDSYKDRYFKYESFYRFYDFCYLIKENRLDDVIKFCKKNNLINKAELFGNMYLVTIRANKVYDKLITNLFNTQNLNL